MSLRRFFTASARVNIGIWTSLVDALAPSPDRNRAGPCRIAWSCGHEAELANQRRLIGSQFLWREPFRHRQRLAEGADLAPKQKVAEPAGCSGMTCRRQSTGTRLTNPRIFRSPHFDLLDGADRHVDALVELRPALLGQRSRSTGPGSPSGTYLISI